MGQYSLVEAGVLANGVVESETDAGSRYRSPSQLLWIAAVIGIVLVLLFSAHLWHQTGTRLSMDGGGLGMSPRPIGSSLSFGVGMTTHGGSIVVVEQASAKHSSNIDVDYAIIHFAGTRGIGTADGAIPGATPLGARGIRVAQPAPDSMYESCTAPGPGNIPPVCTPPAPPDRGLTQLIVTVTARSPGPWSVSDITVRYRSGWRTRSAKSTYVVRGEAT
jgi:hypothetical protein